MLFEDTSLWIWWAIATYAIVQFTFGIHDGLKSSNDELVKQLHKRLDEIVHRVRVEKDKETYYWYDMDNNKFLGQGSTEEELIGNLKSRFPDHMFFLPTNHLVCAKTDWQPKIVEEKQ
jgi:hypothetical protein